MDYFRTRTINSYLWADASPALPAPEQPLLVTPAHCDWPMPMSVPGTANKRNSMLDCDNMSRPPACGQFEPFSVNSSSARRPLAVTVFGAAASRLGSLSPGFAAAAAQRCRQ